jgi:hypothetical protein
MTTIKDLKKGAKFIFNGILYTVKKKYVDDDHPLVALNERDLQDELFHMEELEVTIPDTVI